MLAPSVAKAPSYIDPFCCCKCDRECAAVNYNKYVCNVKKVLYADRAAAPARRGVELFTFLRLRCKNRCQKWPATMRLYTMCPRACPRPREIEISPGFY